MKVTAGRAGWWNGVWRGRGSQKTLTKEHPNEADETGQCNYDICTVSLQETHGSARPLEVNDWLTSLRKYPRTRLTLEWTPGDKHKLPKTTEH